MRKSALRGVVPSLLFSALCATATGQSCDVRLQASNTTGVEKMGTAVCLTGDLVFSSAPGERALSGTDVLGAVYVHQRDAQTMQWGEVARLQPATLIAGDSLGKALDVSGTTLAIGAPGDGSSVEGKVYVMSHGGQGANWVVDAELIPSDGAAGDRFGESVAIDGDYILVGSPGNDGAGNHLGAAYAFQKIGGVWVETQKILPPTGISGSGFGAAVALDGDLITVGGSFLNNRGALGAFSRGVGGQYNFLHVVQGAGVGIADFFASSVDLHGDLLVVGTTNDDDGAGNAGAVHVFRFDVPQQLFLEEAKLLRTSALSGEFLGTSVATDGTTIVAGARNMAPGGGAVAFRDSGSGWAQIRRMQPEELGANGNAGNAVAVEGDVVLIGDSSDGNLAFLGGATFVVDVSLADQNDNGIGDLCENLTVYYCDPAVNNSTGQPGVISAFGSPFVADNQMTLTVSSMPSFQFGIFITSQTPVFVPNPGGSLGNLCVGGFLGRYNQGSQIFGTSFGGTADLSLDLTQTPTPNGNVAIQAGETWNFQAWHRDTVGGQSASNFTNAVSIAFQ